ncbi:MAG: VrrA/YqfQ family protein [Bacilli bacterium]|nr:VrrA/YqfQ family protein [Bacilli bacterium]MDD4607955.1 VrrA/YqfQ family protein [Bacilli bacterium]
MNYYNPYYMNPYAVTSYGSRGLFGGLFRGINWGNLISGTQKTLGLINQAIPVVKQITPVLRNTKTMFRVMNEFKKVDTPSINNKTNNTLPISETKTSETNYNINDGGPTFFI